MQGDSIHVTLRVTRVLDELRVAYAIGGSLSSSMHGVMRSSLDADILADLRMEHVEPLVAALSEEFYADAEMMRDAIRRHASFNLIHYETSFKVDIFIPKSRAFDRVQLERRHRSLITDNPEESVYVTSAEDVVLAKLEWFRMGGETSDRQWRDVLGVLKARAGSLDLDYLKRWARELKIEDLLERAVREA